MKYDNEFKNIDNKFKSLVKNEKLNIDSIEDLMLDNIENYKNRLKNHIEELLSNEVNEKELINKKNKNGKTKDLN
jgi:hypothetical protein